MEYVLHFTVRDFCFFFLEVCRPKDLQEFVGLVLLCLIFLRRREGCVVCCRRCVNLVALTPRRTEIGLQWLAVSSEQNLKRVSPQAPQPSDHESCLSSLDRCNISQTEQGQVDGRLSVIRELRRVSWCLLTQHYSPKLPGIASRIQQKIQQNIWFVSRSLWPATLGKRDWNCYYN